MERLIGGLLQPYLQNALCAGVAVAVVAAAVGYFVVVRKAAFAMHALSQIGFAGAGGAVLVGIEPLVGILIFAVVGALGLGALAARSRLGDATTALVLACAHGTGALTLALAHNYASNVFSFLFGTLVGVDRAQVALTASVAVVALGALAIIARPLMFATVAPDSARSRGVPVASLDIAFFLIIALTAAVTVPVVGALLVYSLAVGPAATASRLSSRPSGAIALAVGFGTAAVIVGVALAYLTQWPVGFYISGVTTLQYLAVRVLARKKKRAFRMRSSQGQPADFYAGPVH